MQEVVVDSVSEQNPTFLYFARRKGWTDPNSCISDSAYFNSLVAKGSKYVVVEKKLFGELTLGHAVMHHIKEYFKIYRIEE